MERRFLLSVSNFRIGFRHRDRSAIGQRDGGQKENPKTHRNIKNKPLALIELCLDDLIHG